MNVKNDQLTKAKSGDTKLMRRHRTFRFWKLNFEEEDTKQM